MWHLGPLIPATDPQGPMLGLYLCLARRELLQVSSRCSLRNVEELLTNPAILLSSYA